MKTNHLLPVVGIALATLANNFAQAQAKAETSPRYVESELLVKFKGGPRGDAAVRAKAALNHEVKRHFDFIGWQQIKLPAGMTVEEGLGRYKNLPDVLAAEANEIIQMENPAPFGQKVAAGSTQKSATAVIPNDPLLSGQYGLEKIAARFAWNVTTGSVDVVVAVVDGGINYNHEDVRDNMWRNPGEIPGNGIDDDGNGYVDDVYGIDAASHDSDPMDQGGYPFHGTGCAGIIGALGNNGKGIVGVNWNVRLMAIRVFDDAGSSSAASRIEAFQYLVTMKRRGVNVRITSNSYGSTSAAYNNQAFKDAMIAAAAEGMLHVCAAANDSQNIDVNRYYPAAFDLPSIIAVAASDAFDNLAYFSNFGRTNVDLAAPGVSIFLAAGPNTNDYAVGDGTSFACPYVVGSAALLAAAYPGASADQMKQALLESVDVLPAFTNKMVSNGRLNLARAMVHGHFTSSAPPVIVAEPLSQSVPPTTSLTLRVSAAGTEPLSYTWQQNAGIVLQGSGQFLELTNVSVADAGEYRVIVSNAFGVVTSAVVTVKGQPEPASFTRVTGLSPVTTTGNHIACAWGDYDNDGDIDLFVTREGGGNLLHRNNGNGTFTSVSAGVNDTANSWSCAWGDYDRDGFLDLFVANGGNQGAQDGFLYHNNGNGTFTRMTTNTAGTIAAGGGASTDCAWADYDRDGFLDLFVANGSADRDENNFLYRNLGDGRFAQIIQGDVVNDGGRSLGVAWGDYDNDGLPDLFVANRFFQNNNFLYRNANGGAFTRIVTGEIATDDGFFQSGAWGDYDNDGDLDLFVSRFGQGILYRNDGDGVFTPTIIANDSASSGSATWGDYDNDGFLDLFVANQLYQNNFLYHNNGDGTFRRVTTGYLVNDGGFSAGCAWGDYDNDGFLDLFVTNYGENNFLYHNDGNSNRWLQVKCLGTASNRSAIGTKVRVRAVIRGSNVWQLREIGTGDGWTGQNSLTAAFGLGDATNLETLRIEWPSGTVQELTNVSPNQFLTITEPGFALVRDAQDTSVRLGSNTNLSVLAYSDHSLTFQWQFNGADLLAETHSTLPITNAQVAHEGDYSVVMNDGGHSVTSRVSHLAVLMNPAVLQPPLSQSVVAGGNVTVSVTVTGNPPPFLYQWRKGTLPAGALTNIVLDGRTCFFTLTNLQTNQGGLYRVVITNAAITNLNIGANFTLTVLADTNTNGLPDDWETDYGVSDPLGDADGDGLNNLEEYIAGTNPTNALSYLKIEQSSAPGSNTVSFLAVSNRTYTIEFTEALGGGVWTKATDVVARSTNRIEKVVVPTAANRHFYRVVTPRQP